MPRPKRSKVTPSAPAQLPEGLMRAIRTDASSKKEAVEKAARRSSVRQASKPIVQDVFMSGALGVRSGDNPAKSIATGANRNAGDGNTTASDSEEREIVPSSMEPVKVQETEPSSTAVPSTVQRPIPQKTAMFSGNWRTQATPRFDSSVLGNFKRRPRQPSILGIGRQDDSSTMSHLGGPDSDPFYSELEDFDPGTAMPLARPSAILQKEIASADHKSETSTTPILNPRKRRRDSSQDPAEILIPRSPQLTSEEADRLFGSSPTPIDDQPDEIEPSLPTIAAPTTSRSSETSPPEVWSDTMAPPQSSPSETPSEPKKPKASPNPKDSRRRKPSASPASPKKSLHRTRAQSSRVLKPISTAQLQNLLPLRRDKSQKDDSARSDRDGVILSGTRVYSLCDV